MLLAEVYLGSLLALGTVELLQRLMTRACRRPLPPPPVTLHKEEGYADL